MMNLFKIAKYFQAKLAQEDIDPPNAELDSPEEDKHDKYKTRTLYHIGKRPPSPKPYNSDLSDKWERDWLPEGISSGVFLTPNPIEVRISHYKWGHVYTFEVPEWVIRKSGGIHRFDNASEVLIPENLWKYVKFVGKSIDKDELEELAKKEMSISRDSVPKDYLKDPKLNYTKTPEYKKEISEYERPKESAWKALQELDLSIQQAYKEELEKDNKLKASATNLFKIAKDFSAKLAP